MFKTNAGASDFSVSKPLCRRYFLAVLEDLSTTVGAEGHVREQQLMRWGIGVLADGQHELLGMWHDKARDGTIWPKVFDDLKVRGVEKIRFVASTEPTDDESGLRKSYLDSTVLPSIRHFGRQVEADLSVGDRKSASAFVAGLYAAKTIQSARALLANFATGVTGPKRRGLVSRWSQLLEQLAPLYVLSPRHRRVIFAADSAARELRRDVSRAVARRGCFPNLLTATSSVAEELARSQNDFGVFGDARAATPAHCAASQSLHHGWRKLGSSAMLRLTLLDASN